MRTLFSLYIIVCFTLTSHAQNDSTNYWENIIEVHNFDDSASYYFVKTDDLYDEAWYQLEHPDFWRNVMQHSEEVLIINHFQNRNVYGLTTQSYWDQFTDEEKEEKRDSIRKAYNLPDDDRIFVTTGKADFYQFDLVMPSISRGIEIFIEEKTDPWYAQCILLIESPGKIEYSTAGALGPFQLMKTVARSHGLKVNKYVDERKDFDKSAKAAASLIRTTCIPEAKNILKKNNISFNTDELWFKLFVLHIYHAGSYNVGGLIEDLAPEKGGLELISLMWVSEWGKFKNASQNYTQVALAALFELREIIEFNCTHIMECEIPATEAE